MCNYSCKISNIVFWSIAISVLLILFNTHYAIITFPFPLEFREGHMMGTTSQLLNLINPYNIENYPQYYNSYGIVYNLVVYPFTFIFKNLLLTHRIVNAIFIFLSLFLIIFYNKVFFYKNLKFGIALLILLYSKLLLRETSVIRPDSLGVFLYLWAIFIVLKYEFSQKSLFFAAIISIIGFYTKPYFILSWVVVNIMMFVNKSWQKIFITNLFFLIFFGVTLIIINKIFPLYFYETLFGYNGSSPILMIYSLRQIYHFILNMLPIWGPMIILFLIRRKINYEIVFKILKHPLFYGSLIILFLLIFPLGTNNGAYMNYHYQLLLPLIILTIINIKLKFQLKPFFKDLLLITGFIILIPTILLQNTNQNYSFDEWKKIEIYTQQYEKILNSPMIAPLLIQQQKNINNSGVTGFIQYFKSNDITNYLFSLDLRLESKIKTYNDELFESVKNKTYGAIMVTESDGINYPNFETYGYKLKEKISIYYPQMNNSFELKIYCINP